MNDLELIKEIIELFNKVLSIEVEYSAPLEEKNDVLVEIQKKSLRVEKILRKLKITTVGSQYGHRFDVFIQACSDGDVGMIKSVLPLLYKAEGFLSDPGKISGEFQFSKYIDEDIQERFMLGDYEGATAKAFKLFKSQLHKHTGTQDVSRAIGVLKTKWASARPMNDETKDNFEKGISHLLNSLSYFRNVEFHSEDWFIDEKQEAFYFISMISMAFDFLDKYLDSSS